GGHPGDARVAFGGQRNRFCLADHYGEQVVEVVGDPARQLTDRLQPLRLLQRRLNLPAPLHSYFKLPGALFDSFFQDNVHVAKRRLGPLRSVMSRVTVAKLTGPPVAGSSMRKTSQRTGIRPPVWKWRN